MANRINDPVFGDLEYNEKEGCLEGKISMTIWGMDEEFDLMVKTGKGMEITDKQYNAYKAYMAGLSNFEDELPDAIFSYFKNHYEEIDRERDLDDDLKIDVADEDTILDGFEFKSLFIDSNGNYGWLAGFIWDDYPISVILSDDKIKIYKGYDVLKQNYTPINDDVFGEMVYDYGWQKSVKMDLYGVKGKWIDVVASADPGEGINDNQRKAYQEYLEKEEDFMDEMRHAMITYYLENYEDIEEWNNVPEKYNRQNINMDAVMELLQFKTLYFDEEDRYGWLCDCPWDKSGLAIILSGEEIEVTGQDELIG